MTDIPDTNWEGQPEASEHRTLGERAWCYDCKSYCYRHANCDCCCEAQGWVRLWLRPDGTIVDEFNYHVDLANPWVSDGD